MRKTTSPTLEELKASHDVRCRLASAAYEMWETRISSASVRRTLERIRMLVDRFASNPPVSTHLADGAFAAAAEAMADVVSRCDALLVLEKDITKQQ